MIFDDDHDELEDDEEDNTNRETSFKNDLSGWLSGSKINQLIKSKEVNREDITKYKVGTDIKDNTTFSLDINKCRRNIMLHNKENYPVFTVMDRIENYVEED